MNGGSDVRGRKKNDIGERSADLVTREKEAELLSVAISAAIRGFEGQMKLKNGKPAAVKCTVAEILKLFQLRRELEAERPREITVRWVDDECSTSNQEK